MPTSPLPTIELLSAWLIYLLKFACTEVSLTMFKAHSGAVPEHPPLQLANVLPAGGVAVNVTIVP